MKRRIIISICIAVLVVVVVFLIRKIKEDRIIENELLAPKSCLKFAESEEIYRRNDHDGDGVLEYAPSLAELEKQGLITKDFAAADSALANPQPCNGYLFNVFRGQGPKAVGGRRSYFDDAGNMRFGYSIMAYPSEYGVTARKTFLISNNGVTFVFDYGKDTPKTVESYNEFNEIWIPKPEDM